LAAWARAIASLLGKSPTSCPEGLPHLSDPKEAKEVVGQWPAYRVSTTQVMTMQHRLYDCFWQMRMPELQIGSDVSVALISFLTKQAAGGEIAVPGLKR